MHVIIQVVNCQVCLRFNPRHERLEFRGSVASMELGSADVGQMVFQQPLGLTMFACLWPSSAKHQTAVATLGQKDKLRSSDRSESGWNISAYRSSDLPYWKIPSCCYLSNYPSVSPHVHLHLTLTSVNSVRLTEAWLVDWTSWQPDRWTDKLTDELPDQPRNPVFCLLVPSYVLLCLSIYILEVCFSTACS